jgi:hypothetical protein
LEFWEHRHTVLLHDGEDLDDDLGGRSDHDLSLSSSLGIDDVVLGVSIVPYCRIFVPYVHLLLHVCPLYDCSLLLYP